MRTPIGVLGKKVNQHHTDMIRYGCKTERMTTMERTGVFEEGKLLTAQRHKVGLKGVPERSERNTYDPKNNINNQRVRRKEDKGIKS